MAKLIEEFKLKNGSNVTVYDLGNYTFEFHLSKEGNEDQKFTLHEAQAGITEGNTFGQDDDKYNEEEREAIQVFRLSQDKKNF